MTSHPVLLAFRIVGTVRQVSVKRNITSNIGKETVFWQYNIGRVYVYQEVKEMKTRQFVYL